MEEMLVHKFCCEESTISQQTTQTDSKLKGAIGSPDVGIEKDGLATSSISKHITKKTSRDYICMIWV